MIRTLALLLALTTQAHAWGFSQGTKSETPYRIVTAGTSMPFTFETMAGARTQFIARLPVVFGGNVSGPVKFALDNFYFNTSVITIPNPQVLTITGLCFENETLGTTQRVQFSGSNSIALPSGAVNRQSDGLSPSSFGLTTYTRGHPYWVRITGTMPSAGDLPAGSDVVYPGSRMLLYDPANDIDQVCSTGPLTPPAGAQAVNTAYGPSAIIGKFDSPIYHSVISLGDSWIAGSGDGSTSISGLGLGNHALYANGQNTGPVIAGMRIGRSGTDAVRYAANPIFDSYFKYATVVFSEPGGNDLDTYTPDQILAAWTTLWNRYRAAGVRYIIGFKIPPRTSSTDNWTTVENQTYIGQKSPTGTAPTANDNLTLALAGGKIQALHTNDEIRASSDYWKWAVPDRTADGAHLTTSAYLTLGAVLRATILSFPPY